MRTYSINSIAATILCSLLLLTLFSCRNQLETYEDMYGNYYDQMRLKVVAISPTHESTDISIDSSLSFTFNKAPDLSSLQQYFILTSNDINVACTVDYTSSSANRAVIVPSTPLEYNAEYKVFISGACLSKDGYKMREDYESTFTTAVSPPVSVESLQTMSPNMIKLTFSENIDFETAEAATQYIILDADGNPLNVFSVSQSPSSDKILFLITDNQTVGAEYELTIKDLKSQTGKSVPPSGAKIQFEGYDTSKEQRYFDIQTPDEIIVGKEFTVSVLAYRGTDGQPYVSYYGNLIWEAVGSGQLEIVNSTVFDDGVKSVDMIYNNSSMTEGDTESITLKATAENEITFTGMSSNFTAKAEVFINHFNLITPGTVEVGMPFQITIQAIGGDEEILTTYDGTIILDKMGALGDLTPTTATGFENGELELMCSFTKQASELQIIATDNLDSTVTGTSAMIKAELGAAAPLSIGLDARPFDSTKTHLSWFIINEATLYKIYRDDGSGYVEIGNQGTGMCAYVDTGLTLGETYQYKVEALDAGLNVLISGEDQVTTCACTVISAGNGNNTISGATLWNEANHPYCVEDDVTISNTLQIEEGVNIYFNAGTGMTVSAGGALIALSSGTELIYFTSAEESPVAGDWDGIDFQAGAVITTYDGDWEYVSGSGFQSCVLEYVSQSIFSSVGIGFKNCLIRQNSGGAMAFGGVSGGNIVIKGCEIMNNSGNIIDFWSSGTNMVIDESLFISNSGTIFNVSNANSIHVSNSTFRYNTSSSSLICMTAVGGAWLTGFNFTNNIFDTNTSTNGGILCMTSTDHGSGSSIKNNTFADNIFINNSASSNGGVVYITSAGCCASITDNMFINNYFKGNTANMGGCFYIVGANVAGNTINQNTFIQNEAAQGAVGYWNWQQDTLTRNYFAENHSTVSGALECSNLNMTQNAFENNTSSSVGKNIYGSIGGGILDKNYFDGENASPGLMGICDNSNGCTFGFTNSNIQTDIWPLCSDDPSNPDCVGANFVY